MIRRVAGFVTSAGLAVALASCAAAGPGGGGGSYVAPMTVDPTATLRGISGIGVESQDFAAMSDKMVRDLLATPMFGNAGTPPRVIIDDTRFKNESSQTLNLALLVDRLRIELMRASSGKMLFVSRQNVDLVEKEKQLKAAGKVDAGSSDTKRAIAGADFILIGKIASQTTINQKSGMKANYFQITFEMLDLNNSLTVWGNLYEVKKAGADDKIYRQ